MSFYITIDNSFFIYIENFIHQEALGMFSIKTIKTL